MADLTITITIPDAKRADFLQAYADRYGWVDQATSGTKAAFARDHARDLVRAPFRAWKADQLQAAALATVVIPDDGITAA
jgi:hypothetical protein